MVCYAEDNVTNLLKLISTILTRSDLFDLFVGKEKGQQARQKAEIKGSMC
jgi:hypothetical protein